MIEKKLKPAKNSDKNRSNIDTRRAKIFAQLPEAELLVLNLTTWQVQKWVNLRGFNTEVSACWEAKISLMNDPIVWMRRGTKDNRASHRLIWAYTYMHEAWWNLIQLCFNSTRLAFYKSFRGIDVAFPFSSAYDLFLETVTVEENNQFLTYLEPGQIFSVQSTIKAHKLMQWSSLTETNPELSKNLDRLAPQWRYQNFWQGFCYLVAQQEAKTEVTIANLLRAFGQKVDELSDIKARTLEQSSKGRLNARVYSFAIQDGDEIRASK